MRSDSLESTRVTLLHRLNTNPSDQLSWAEFVRVYGPAIRGWLLHWGLQEADVQDVTQNVLLRLTAKLPQFKYDPARSFRGWLRTLTQHAWKDFIAEQQAGVRGSGDTGVLSMLHTVEARDDRKGRLRPRHHGSDRSNVKARAMGDAAASRPREEASNDMGHSLEFRFLRWRMSSSENRYPLFRDMRYRMPPLFFTSPV